jgi:glycosyltransferase involved in cell wall biosynthesis
MKLFEYMATGIPMIASDLPVLHEVVEDEKEVLFVPPDDPQALTKAMRRLLENPDVAQRIGRNALLRVKEFTWERRAKRIYDFIGRRFPEYTTED